MSEYISELFFQHRNRPLRWSLASFQNRPKDETGYILL